MRGSSIVGNTLRPAIGQNAGGIAVTSNDSTTTADLGLNIAGNVIDGGQIYLDASGASFKMAGIAVTATRYCLGVLRTVSLSTTAPLVCFPAMFSNLPILPHSSMQASDASRQTTFSLVGTTLSQQTTALRMTPVSRAFTLVRMGTCQ
jgi:hypothetical protein